MTRRRRAGRLWAPTSLAPGWGESTYAEQAWAQSRGAGRRWAAAGVVGGAIAAAVAFAPASWLAAAVEQASDGRLLLAEARGSVWSGSAVAVLTGGAGSRTASALPGRLGWTLALRGFGLEVRLQHACCLNGIQALQLRGGVGRVALSIAPGGTAAPWLGQWPAAWLAGLGTPFNTMELGGALRLSSPGFALDTVQGRWRLEGNAQIDLIGVSSRLSTLPTLGSYRLLLSPGADGAGAAMQLSTQDGALQLSGNGQFGANGLRFRGEARAGSGQEAALNNLLNIIGRRDGARSVISIG